MKLKILCLVLLCGVMLFAAGCVTNNNALRNPSVLEPSATLKFNDVPVPAGFKLLLQESYSFQSSGVRVGVLRYVGKADLDQVINFYKEQMAMNNWNLLNIVEYGVSILNFDKEAETCIVNLACKGKVINITISLGSKSVPFSKKAAEPIK